MSISKKHMQLNPQTTILPAKFDNETVTNHVSINYLESFKRKINFRQILDDHFTYEKRHDAKFSTADTLDFIIDASIQGYSRFSHMEDLRKDNGYLKLKSQAPSEKVCRDLLCQLDSRSRSEARLVNKAILAGNWFKSAILPEEWSHYEIKTIRRKFYNLAANLCGTGRYRHIRYARDKAIENLITAVIDRLRRFQLAAA